MNRFKLLDELDRLNIPTAYYSIKGAMDDRICLDEINGQWVVYYIERGKKSELGAFSTESEACSFMLSQLKPTVE
ncbi:hypothetical protein PSECIP111951_04182 [Pseudoalteromonas holothuriae]|uniref:Uncharacterized protein n=1 Tax=Pseudoalteromonas holothuriae TaxID=2963714 RepID=A0ABN8US18_9GAMM|nr:hypothetical protein [Pseudoalteromonas sp. CIP111951]CAH9068527.1 hypothetical protein PSECIP111951_04182 [Pseudoalteromonas sp. CIP111951]